MDRPRFEGTPQRGVVLAAGIAVIGGGALFIVGEWTAGVGIQGLIDWLTQNLGILVFGIGIATIGVCFARWLVGDFLAKSSADRRDTLHLLGKQFAIALLNIVVYGGIFIMALGALAALDGASAGTILVVIAIWALCIVVFIGYRRFRHGRKIALSLVGYVAMSVFLCVFGVGMLWLGISSSANAFRDLSEGPVTADVFLVDARIDNPNWRYRIFVQSDHVLTFYTPQDERIVVEVPEQDIGSAKVINDYGNFVHLTYYPQTQIFCDASPWPEGRQVMGEDLLERLNEQYDFEL